MTSHRALIVGLQGTDLSADELAFLRDVQPWGVILFARNLDHGDQIHRLVSTLKETLAGAATPILIDQEGGRVARLRPPLARAHLPADIYGQLYAHNQDQAIEACFLGGVRLAEDLRRYGITVNCAPCLDVRQADADDIIGDRAFSSDPNSVAILGQACINGLKAGGVMPVIKHIPGHGRAKCDSHHALPIIRATYEALRDVDFYPFSVCREGVLAMTGHLLFEALDGDHVSTCSPHIIEKIIRQEIGFTGLLMSDDISMQALAGTIEDRARQALGAGCDLILHCNGDMDEMTALAEVCPDLSALAATKSAEIGTFLASQPLAEPADEDRWGELVSPVWKAD